MGHYDSCREYDNLTEDAKKILELEAKIANLTVENKSLKERNKLLGDISKELDKYKNLQVTNNIHFQSHEKQTLPSIRTNKVYYKNTLIEEIVWIVIEYNKYYEQKKYFALERSSLNVGNLFKNKLLIECVNELIENGFECDSHVDIDYVVRDANYEE